MFLANDWLVRGLQFRAYQLGFSASSFLFFFLICFSLFIARSSSVAQGFAIRNVSLPNSAGLQLDIDLVPGFYSVLSTASSIDEPFKSIAISMDDSFVLSRNDSIGFYFVRWIPFDDAEDQDGDGISDVFELLFGLSPFDALDASLDPDGDGADNLAEFLKGTDPNTPDQLTSVVSSSPAAGESDVAITRETIIRFSDPLDASVTADPSAVEAFFGGERRSGRLHRSADARSLTLFYDDVLPPSARVRIVLNGDLLIDARGLAVDADGDGVPGGVMEFDYDTLGLASVTGTAVCGRVFASELVTSVEGVMSVNQPLEGVRITVDGLEEELFAFTDQNGNFRLDSAPTGRFFVHIDGRSATTVLPDGAYYPFVGKTWESEAGIEVNVGEIFLPLVRGGTLQSVSEVEETTVGFAPDVVDEFPEFGNVSLTVPAGALLNDSGEAGGMVGIAPVDPARLPGPLPDGLDFPLVITVQTDGATNFDQPVPVCFPNLPDPETGLPLLPGERSGLWSFNHDTGAWEVVGSMTVSLDGTLVCSDPGSGILAPGWQGTRRGTQGGGGSIVRRRGGSESDSEPGGSSRSRNCPDNGEACPEIAEQDPGKKDTDPVYLFSGEFYLDVEDLKIPGRGKDFVWARKYRSKIGPSTGMGHQWDYSYNISIERDEDGLLLADGNSRRDRYPIRPSGSFARAEFFREFVEVSPDTFHLVFSDRGRWEFNPLDDSLAAGKISLIVDRNDNTIQISYDELGRLKTIVDTLDRTIQIAWNEAGLIESVTDFSGRIVRYEYFGEGEEGGNPGDLKSVTSPAVVGSTTGNDFPNGKRVSYTYTTGFEDDRLNHNLLAVTDGRRNDPNDPSFGEGPFLRNRYALTTDPNDLDFDRIVSQAWGAEDDLIHFHYSELRPSPANGESVIRAILNDRNGNVRETFYDRRNRMTRLIEFTGRADADLATTPSANRPVRKLRSTDPAFYVTSYEWNDDSQMTRVVFPNGNEKRLIYESDLNPTASSRSRGNLRQVVWSPGTHQPAGEQETIVQRFEYQTDFNFGCCNFNFVTAHYDGRGNVTRHEYDDRGNRVRTTHRIESIVLDYEFNAFGQLVSQSLPDNGSDHRRVDRFEYYDSGTQRGYRSQKVEDVGGFQLTTRYEYDLVGNVIRQIDPRGNDMLIEVNELNQVVRKTSREVENGTGIRYYRDYHYDANNNVVRIDVLNLDHLGESQANPLFSEYFEYELLNQLTRHSQEVDEEREVVTEYRYDANRNRIASRYGESVAARQPTNGIDYVYDERDLLYRTIHGPGSDEQSTDEWSYDLNGNLTVMRVGIESDPRIQRTIFDGYDRKIEVIDPMGNERLYRYDRNHNLSSELFLGELIDVSGGEGNVRLLEVRHKYDPLDRKIEIQRQFFDSRTQEAIGDGDSKDTFVFSDNSQVLQRTNDNGHTVTQSFDSANRLAQVEDAAGNLIGYGYDANSNVVTVTEIEKSDLGTPDEVFVTRHRYDNLNRIVRTVDNAGNVTDMGYDSRHNKVFYSDALRPSPEVFGNIQISAFDGLNRPLSTTRFLTESGRGDGVESGRITTSMRWDDSSRLAARVDDSGNATQFRYDSLNRVVEQQSADGTLSKYSYDVHGNLVGAEDPNGTLIVSQFDQLNRIKETLITPSQGVSDDTTSETFEYDGLSRVVLAIDDDSRVERFYDSLSNVIEERLNGQISSSTFDGVGNKLESRYPGGREVMATFDVLERRIAVSDQAGVISEDVYVGPARLAQRVRRNGTVTDYGYDSVKRPESLVHSRDSVAQESVFDSRQFGWGAAFNKRSMSVEGAHSVSYDYDSTYRLKASERVETGSLVQEHFSYDGAGNRIRVSSTDPLASHAGQYELSSVMPEPADRPVNQYTSTPLGTQMYDPNGNLIQTASSSGDVEVAYDYRNRMVRFGSVEYRYDVFGRRIQRAEDGDVTLYFYNDRQVCEEQDGENVTLATYVYGSYVDDVVQMVRGGKSFYYHSDDRYNTVVLTDSDGNVAERYDYAAYGAPTVMDSEGAVVGTSTVGNPYLFQGRRFDDESGWYYYRNRFLDPVAGRFTTRDPIGIWGTRENVGNGYSFVGNNPATSLDPFGLDREIVLGLHAYITVDTYRNGKKVGQRDLDFAPSRLFGTDGDDWTDKLPRNRAFYQNWVVRIRVPSTMEEDIALLREWRSRREKRWNPIQNCWWATLTGYDVGISRDRSWDGLTDWGSFLVNGGEVDIIREGGSGEEATIRPYEPTLTESVSQGIDNGLEYLEENVAQPIVDFFDDPKPALNSLGNAIVGLFSGK